MQTQADIDFAADLFRQARHAIVLTGAGISTPSGIPDFRSTETGLWSKDEPLEAASLNTFRTRPERFFEWFRPLASQILDAVPNPAHTALAALEEKGWIKSILTQNIDMLHWKAGSKNVIELHGTLRTLTCAQCYHNVTVEAYIAPYIEDGSLPLCPKCGGLLKPDVILFGEQLPQAAVFKAQQETLKCDLMLVAGSSLEVLPVAGLPMQALDHGAHLIIVNNAPTYVDVRADIIIQDDVASVLPSIMEKVING